MKPYTEAQYKRFKRLVEMGESQNQLKRIESRLNFPKFIEEVGKDKCDIMFERLKKE